MKSKMQELWMRVGTGTLCVLMLLAAAPGRSAEDAPPLEAREPATNTVAAEAERASGPAEAVRKEAHDVIHSISSALTGVRISSGSDEIVEFGRAVELKAGETANDVVVIGGSAKVDGRVRDALVAVGGNIILNGEANGDVVAVMGSISLGSNAVVRGDTVAVLGKIELEPGASVHGDSVAVGGRVECPDGATVSGEKVSVTLPGLGWLAHMGDWVSECVFKLRPLSFKVGWVWVVAGMYLLLYLLVALAFPRPVEACVDELTRRPATTLLMGLLTKILMPILILILLAIGIGVFIVPFLSAAVFIAGVVGKVALLAYFGRQLGRQFGANAFQPLLGAFLLGWVIVTLLYVVPILGLVVYTVTGMWALGVAVMALFGGMRREMPPRPPAAPPIYSRSGGTTPPVAGLAPMPMTAGAAAMAQAAATDPVATEPQTASAEPATESTETPPVYRAAAVSAPGVPPTGLPEALSLPRASFWERMGAGFLDIVLVSLLGGLVGGPPWGFLVALAYFAGMWAWKGTTVGGIVLKLKVVRLDGAPVTFPVALVRGLAAAFSTVVLFLGFLWIAWDVDKQGWHDKIAGTVVVRLPHTQSLMCF